MPSEEEWSELTLGERLEAAKKSLADEAEENAPQS